jgi:hypothetical protein
MKDFNFTMGSTDDNSTWNIKTNGWGLFTLPGVHFNLTTNEKGTVNFGVAGKEFPDADLMPNQAISINNDMFLEFTQNCDPTKKYLWDDTTDRATEVS